jgi:pyruvate/2-oxoglutarate dehydrogenase complex dihydrolipoamide dehydrogenase (E3) component
MLTLLLGICGWLKQFVEPAPVMLKILVQAETRQILGLQAIGRQAAEPVNFASVAMRSDLTLNC